ncbi:MAG: C40 family peptidase [Ginsengibacter sp.]
MLTMKYFTSTAIVAAIFLLQSCSASRANKSTRTNSTNVTTVLPVSPKNSEAGKSIPARNINTKNVDPNAVVRYAETLIGVKYKYGSAVKENGFDCSGFITYVFNHYNIPVPRVSKDFTNAGTPVALEKSKKGDLILFTGTDTTGWVVGHMGIITENDSGKIRFIHSSSGKSIGVIISGLSNYYATRFVKVIRVFNH